MNVLETYNLKKYYGNELNQIRALDGVDLQVKNKEFVAIMGASGSGKSTLLHMIGGLDKPTEGEVIINGQRISEMEDEQSAIFRRRTIGFVFQAFNLIPMLDVYENIVFPLELDNVTIDESFVDEVMKALGIEDKKHFNPNQLSGGQQQRVAIARALVTKPAIILADEPTGNLDSVNSKEVLNILKKSSEKFGQTIVMITHDEQVAKLADRIVCIQDGRLVGENR